MDKRKMMTTLAGLGVSAAAALSGAFLVWPSEGSNPGAYLDPVGIVTACYGHTGNDVMLGQVFSERECLDKFAKDLSKAEDQVDNVIKVPLTIYQRAALISFTYNVGPTNLAKSTLAKNFNAGKYELGCQGMLEWVYAKKKKLPGLVTRRQLEYKMCIGDVSAN